jgi:hypothetical protein
MMLADHAATDGRMRQRNSTLGHHLDEISKTELEAQIPSYSMVLPFDQADKWLWIDTNFKGHRRTV